DCDNNASNGCEVNKNTDVNNCGACGTKCMLANATATCTNGACAVQTCNNGFADCDGIASNGCEVNLTTSTANCGSGSNARTSTNGTPACALGACSITCNAGFADCDMNLSNGCEVNTTGNVANCGMCGKQCSAAGGVPNCINSVCGISTCNAPQADC